MAKINFKSIEKKWQKAWEKAKIFEANLDKRKKFFVLEMFPYPSGSGLHMGHAFNYTIGDIYARFKRMQEFNVLYPMGYDALGLPAENAAIKEKIHPKKYTDNSVKNFIKQQKALGLSYDWSRMVRSDDAEYYKWDQWIFLKMFEKGLAFRKKASVNFCRKCNSVLANEQVHNGKCWRHEDTEVETKELEQWFFKITDYAEELYDKIDSLNWPERIKIMQKNWIGKSYGIEILFEVENPENKIENLEFVFFHAFQDNSKSVFWDWLKKEIESRGGKVAFAPDLPNTNQPNINEQLDFVLKNYKFKENTVLITHSLGSVLAMKLLPKLKNKIKKLFLIAPPLKPEFKDNKKRPILENYCDWKFDFEEIKAKAEKIEVILDKQDHILLDSHPKKIAELLLANLTEAIGEKTHFNNNEEKELSKIIFNIWPIFTTRPDTIYGVTFMVVSARHPKLMEIVTEKQRKEVEEFLEKIKSINEKDMEELEKEGVFTGSYAINPINNEKIPVYAGNFVVADYGCGMVMAVPAHDQRDFEFAKKYDLQIKEVISPVFETLSGPDALRKDKPIDKRDTVVCIVKHWCENKYLCLNWKKKGWKTFVVGGIENNEDKIKAGIREIKEETGYQNIKFVKELTGEINNKFFATHKNENRWAVIKGLYFELLNSKRKIIATEENELHEAVWVEKDKILSYLHDDESDKILWRKLIGLDTAFTEEGILINSEQFNGMNSRKAIDEILKYLEKKKFGKETVNYKLKDWLISRQRYWGTPIPIIYCDKCGIVPVPEKELPIILPEKVKFGEGNPLATNENFVNTKCPKCKEKAKRETDTMDTFVNSSWYFLRYCDSKNKKKIFDKKKVEYWMPIDQYIGGAEHACMHLIYFRFYTKFLRDLGLLNIDEPASKLFNQGMVCGPDGAVMSKSRGNVVNPIDIINKYSTDILRLYLVSVASPDKDFIWDDKGIQGSLRFINKLIDYFAKFKNGESSNRIESKLNKAIKEITDDIENFRYNLAIIKLRQLFESIEKEKISKKDAESFLKLLSPFCPHITEELWSKLGHKDFISLADWPKTDEKKIDKKLEEQDKAIEKLKEDINNIKKIIESKGKKTEKVYVYVLPKELELYKELENEGIKVFSVADKNKYDPTNKSKNSKPGKPAIYLE